MRMGGAIGVAAALTAASPALAATVSAARPDSLAEALSRAGYAVVAGTDDTGDPVLDLDMQGYKARLLFLDCDPARHDSCGSVQFFAAFDAEGPGLTPADAVAFARRHRYAAVTLNGTGDPMLRWDIETGAGIPREVFQTAAARFLGTVQAMGAMLFPKTAGQ
ncbi:MAG: YbjN domain-containing protein [Novosphingobium sp.]|nr:YbjN domain-containing protein [Novosphingobium sp.]